jgi:hypothetical protein
MGSSQSMVWVTCPKWKVLQRSSVRKRREFWRVFSGGPSFDIVVSNDTSTLPVQHFQIAEGLLPCRRRESRLDLSSRAHSATLGQHSSRRNSARRRLPSMDLFWLVPIMGLCRTTGRRACYALLRMRPLSIPCAKCSVVISCGKVDYDKSG